jgi:hypothetical protein
MNGREERQCLADIRWMRRMLGKLDDRRILEALAKDEVSAATGQPDPIHVGVSKLCDHIGKAADLIAWSVGTVQVLEQVEPTGEREAAVPDCLACGELALPRPRGGFCNACATAYYRRDKSMIPDRPAFILWRKSEDVADVATLESMESVPGTYQIGKP